MVIENIVMQGRSNILTIIRRIVIQHIFNWCLRIEDGDRQTFICHKCPCLCRYRRRYMEITFRLFRSIRNIEDRVCCLVRQINRIIKHPSVLRPMEMDITSSWVFLFVLMDRNIRRQVLHDERIVINIRPPSVNVVGRISELSDEYSLRLLSRSWLMRREHTT